MKLLSVSAQLKNYRKRIQKNGFFFICSSVFKNKKILHKVILSGAGDRCRTCMPKALDPKSSASANFATPACIRLIGK